MVWWLLLIFPTIATAAITVHRRTGTWDRNPSISQWHGLPKGPVELGQVLGVVDILGETLGRFQGSLLFYSRTWLLMSLRTRFLAAIDVGVAVVTIGIVVGSVIVVDVSLFEPGGCGILVVAVAVVFVDLVSVSSSVIPAVFSLRV